jgi:hypothetical protein
MRKTFLTIALLTYLFTLQAQNIPEVGDMLMSNGKIYAVITVMSIILLGIAVLLIRMDRKVQQLEDQHNKKDL